MTKSEMISRYNAESAEKVMYFNGLPPDKQLLVAGDKAFRQHDCRCDLFGSICRPPPKERHKGLGRIPLPCHISHPDDHDTVKNTKKESGCYTAFAPHPISRQTSAFQK